MSSKFQRTIYSGFSSLSLSLKERQIKIARSDMNKENKERVNRLGQRMCVSLQQHSSTHKAALWLWDRATFVFSGIHVLVSVCLKLWLCYQSCLRFILTPSIFLREREIPHSNFLIPPLLGILGEPTQALSLV